MKTAPGLHLDLCERLRLLRALDPLRKWESLDDQRVCRCCHKFISGRQIEVGSTPGKPLRLVCPTTDCSATVLDWVYPNEIARRPNARERRVLRVIDKSGESFIACEKPYSRRRASQRLGLVQGLPRNAHAPYIQIVASPKLAILSLSRLR